MERLPITGVCSATNAFAVSDDARRAYLHDPKADVVVSIDLEKGNKKFLKWDDKNFAHRRWVCYSLFALTKDDQECVSILFFNQHKKVFCLVHFIVNGELLVKVQTNALNTSTINKERLAYSVSKDGNNLQIIFYERFSSAASSPAFATHPARLRFILCSFSPSTMRVTTTNGLLPASGQWELPFISNQSLHFISTASTPHLFISYPRSEPATWEHSTPQPMGIMANEAGYPPRKALWCNAWTAGIGWFSVTEKIESDGGSMTRKMGLWKLDVDSEWRWRKHAASLDAPEYTRSIALRLTPPMPSSPCFGFVHADWQYGEAALFRVRLDSPQGPFRTSARPLSDTRLELNESTSSADSDLEDDDGLVLRRRTHRGRYQNRTPSREHLADLQCPICLDTYEDARTLNCGHSMCWECIEQMRISVKNETIRCPNCRAPTTIPPGGLPINYGLKDAIAALSRLVVTRRGCLRCVGCRDKTETDKLWVCITCYRNDDKEGEIPEAVSGIASASAEVSTSTPLRRPTSLYLPSSSSFSSTATPSEQKKERKRRGSAADLSTPPSTTEKRTSPQTGSSAQDQRLAHHAHCAACLLNDHAGHEYEGFAKIRERASAIARRRDEYARRAVCVIEAIRERTAAAVEDKVCAPLLLMACGKLDTLMDVVVASDVADVERRSEAVLARLQDICNRFTAEAESLMVDLLECCSADQSFSPRSSLRPRSQISHRATEL